MVDSSSQAASPPPLSFPALRRLARLAGVVPTYRGLGGDAVSAKSEVLASILRTLGVLEGDDVEASTRALKKSMRSRHVQPCAPSWCDAPARVHLRCGFPSAWTLQVFDESDACIIDRALDAGLREVDLGDLPMGYYRVVLSCGDDRAEQHLLRAPRRAYALEGSESQPHRRRWGIFAPLYAFAPEEPRQGGASFRELAELWRESHELGAELVGSLPLLAGFHSPVDSEAKRFEESPYRPVSRRHWNEVYLDLAALPELSTCPEAAALWESSDYATRGRTLAEAPEVNLPAIAAHKHELLRTIATWLQRDADASKQLEEFLVENADVRAYAEFRAALVPEDDRNLEATLHAYCQWQCRRQLASLGDVGLYLDLAVGVHPDGYDAQVDASEFASHVDVGAPPDAMFRSGQNWGLPAMHPQGSRAGGHSSFRKSLAEHMRYAKLLRLDHVMGLHRIYWIPRGVSAKEGTYVYYPAEELYAIISIESHRHQCAVVGEDLGLVAPSVRRALDEHALGGMLVSQFDLHGMHHAGPRTVASFGTHDTATFAGFARAFDLHTQRQIGLLDEGLYRELLGWREGGAAELARICESDDLRTQFDTYIKKLAASPAGIVLVSLEDLWLEERQQNVPGSSWERPNWKQRFAQPWRQALRDFAPLFAEIHAARR